MKVRNVVAGLALSFASVVTSAAVISADGLFTYTGPNFETIASNNDFISSLGDGAASTYGIGGSLALNQSADLTFTYLGYEAGYDNDFLIDDVLIFSNRGGNASAIPSTHQTVMDVLSFGFYANNVSSGVSNPNSPYNNTQSFAVMFDTTFNGTMYDTLLFWDDSGAGPDDNHDDMVVGINAFAVSEPATLVLMGLGLLGLGVARRRQA
jgi:hypothetical protein